jgi:hypothetical protein
VDLAGQTVAYHLTAPYNDNFNFFSKNYEIDNEGNFIVGDVCCEYRAFKFLKDGGSAWEYNKPFTFSPLPTVPARLTSFAINHQNEVYLGGSYYQSDSTSRASLITKLDALGNLLWEHLFISKEKPVMNLGQLVPDDEGVLGVGSATTIDGNNYYDFLILNYTSDGDKKIAGISDLDSIRNTARSVILLQNAFYVAGVRFVHKPSLLQNEQILAKYSRSTIGATTPNLSAEIPLSVSPNPFTDAFTVIFEQSDGNRFGDLALFDPAGKMLIQKRIAFTPGKNEVTLALGTAFPIGPYYVSLQAGDHRYTVRVVKAE